ncbi:hypothetical protein ACN28G_15075 [Micromonospora sp. WMMA1923]|uniref:hypothetical protein n=1 Tax=Micromonospora sp. WMMA1923 TaxID=3404125 RepID=UPI003B931044
MFLTDPALRRIAADTNDVLPEQLWRHDTATLDPVGDLARILHKTAREFTTSSAALDQALSRLKTLATHARRRLATHADLPVASYDRTAGDALAARERHIFLGALLVTAYRAWRNHRPISTGTEQHLLLYPGDPAHGVATLHLHHDRTWLMVPDTEAADAFAVAHPGQVIGELTETSQGWTPTAHPTGTTNQPDTTWPLPACDDLPSACRSLLRWRHLHHSGRKRTPDQLTPDELAQLRS